MPPQEAVAWELTDNEWRCCGLRDVMVAGWYHSGTIGDGAAAEAGQANEPRCPRFCFRPSAFLKQPGALDIIRLPSGALQHTAAREHGWYTIHVYHPCVLTHLGGNVKRQYCITRLATVGLHQVMGSLS